MPASVELKPSMMDRIDAAFFTFSALSAAWLAYLLLRDGIDLGFRSLLLLLCWIFIAYLLLPRLHRILTRLYVPGYFIGRARTSDGLLGDPINLALLGREGQIHEVMTSSGWIRADDLDLLAGRRIVTSTLRRQSYPQAPVSPLLLFDRQQDFAYQQEVAGNPAKRHHVRFWRCPEGWMLPGGHSADWLAAGTYDRSVGFSLFTFQVTHKIEANTDIERDFIVESVRATRADVAINVIENFSTGYHSRNGGGDMIITDGDLPVLDVRDVAAPYVHHDDTDSRDRRPAPIIFGAGFTFLRGLMNMTLAVVLFFSPDSFSSIVTGETFGLTRQEINALELFTSFSLAIWAVVDCALGIAVLYGLNWARLLLMALCTFSTTVGFLTNLRAHETVTLAGLPIVGFSILVLLALSSHSARDYATRKSHVIRH